MAGSLDAQRGLHGALLAGWIEEQVPDEIQDSLFAVLDSWRADRSAPPSHLWHAIAETLRAEGCFDAERACWRTLLGLAPGEPAVLQRLAEAHHRCGDGNAARAALAGIPPLHPNRAAALILRLELADSTPAERADCAAELAAVLVEPGEWSPLHHRFIRGLVSCGLAGRASAFLAEWRRRHAAEGVEMLLEQGWLAMHAGDAPAARMLFERLWRLGAPEIEGVAGRFDGTVPPYTPALEQAIAARIEAAFARPEAELDRVVLADGDLPPVTVIFAGFERMTMPNDLAEHYRRSALAAGVDLRLHLDSAIAFADQFRGDDATVAGRVAAFEAVLAERRPDVVILDCAYLPSRRGLRPDRMRQLADQLGFRLVCMMRDALESNLDYLRAWAPAADLMVTYDPVSALLRPEFRTPTLVTLPPAQHLRFGTAERDLGLVFMGNNAYGVRNMLLSVLLTEDIPFTAITGDDRARLAPDMDAYAAVLGRARAVLNVAAHSRSEFLVTGRVFEAIACGAVLLEQANPATARYFTPWRHYLPWDSVADIVQLCRFVERNPAIARRIAAEARSWLDRHYDCRRFWASLLGRHQFP